MCVWGGGGGLKRNFLTLYIPTSHLNWSGWLGGGGMGRYGLERWNGGTSILNLHCMVCVLEIERFWDTNTKLQFTIKA